MTVSPATIDVGLAPDDFDDWSALLQLLRTAFACQESRIDPPSSVYRLDEASLAEKALAEHLFLATSGGRVVGCTFAQDQAASMYVGKVAVAPGLRRTGIGRRLLQAVEALAVSRGYTALELATRIELIENHRTFEALGFEKVSERAHEGFSRPTSITLRKRVGNPVSR